MMWKKWWIQAMKSLHLMIAKQQQSQLQTTLLNQHQSNLLLKHQRSQLAFQLKPQPSLQHLALLSGLELQRAKPIPTLLFVFQCPFTINSQSQSLPSLIFHLCFWLSLLLCVCLQHCSLSHFLSQFLFLPVDILFWLPTSNLFAWFMNSWCARLCRLCLLFHLEFLDPNPFCCCFPVMFWVCALFNSPLFLSTCPLTSHAFHTLVSFPCFSSSIPIKVVKSSWWWFLCTDVALMINCLFDTSTKLLPHSAKTVIIAQMQW